METQKRKNWKSWLPGIAVSVLIIIILFNMIDLDTFLQAFQKAKISTILLAMFILLLANACRAEAWRALLGRRIGLQDAFHIINQGYLLNQIIPRSGEIARAILIQGVVDIQFFEAFSSIAIERAFDLLFTAIMFLSSVSFAVPMQGVMHAAIIILIVVLLGFTFLFWAVRNQEKVAQWCTRVDARSAFFKRYISPNLMAILQGANIVQDPKRLAIAVFWLLMTWVGWISVTYLVMVDFLGSQPLWMLFFVQSVLSLGIALPSAPAGLGVFEGTMVAVLALFNVNRELALSYALVLHMVQISMNVLLGIFSLVIKGNSLSVLLKKVSSQLRRKRSAS